MSAMPTTVQLLDQRGRVRHALPATASVEELGMLLLKCSTELDFGSDGDVTCDVRGLEVCFGGEMHFRFTLEM